MCYNKKVAEIAGVFRGGRNMSFVAVILAEGFEEIEALTVVNLLRRAQVDVRTVSLTSDKMVVGSRNIRVCADITLQEIGKDDLEMLVMPGGIVCRDNMSASIPLKKLVLELNEENSRIAAICAAPSVLGRWGVLEGVKALSYPDKSIEMELKGRIIPGENLRTITDKNITTSSGPATAMEFGLELIKILKGQEVANQVAEGLLYK